MKKILSLTLAALMVVSMVPTAFAADVDYQNGTEVEFTGSRTTVNADGTETHNAEYTITVPALLAPGGSGTVTLQGMWPSDATVKVTAEDKVEMVNNINSADKKELAVTFTAIELAGNNTVAVSDDETVSVADISNALFGTWSGKFNYNVEYNGEAGGSGTVTPTPDPEQPTNPDDGDGEEANLITFTIDGTEYQAEEGMTYREWVNSEYNTDGFLIAHIKHSTGDEMDAIVSADKTKCLFDMTPVKLDNTIRKYDTPKFKDFTASDMWWNLAEPAANLITFTIDGTEYQAEEGMTWQDWCGSDYNTVGALCNGANDVLMNSTYVKNSTGYAKSSDTIVPNFEYSLQ